MTQGDAAWHRWRLQGVGSSDAADICSGSGKHLGLYKVKIGEIPESALGSPFMQEWRDRGHQMEPIARAAYEAHTGIWNEPRLVMHDTFDWMRASLDGLSYDDQIVLEIKCPGKIKHQKALAGKIPAEYVPQTQHQLMVTGCSMLHYWSFDGEAGVLVEVLPDLDYQVKLFEREGFFWEAVQARIPPDLSVCLRAGLKRNKAKTILTGATDGSRSA